MEDVLHDLDVIRAAECLGLSLNPAKCEIICHDNTVRGQVIANLHGAIVMDLRRLACWVTHR